MGGSSSTILVHRWRKPPNNLVHHGPLPSENLHVSYHPWILPSMYPTIHASYNPCLPCRLSPIYPVIHVSYHPCILLSMNSIIHVPYHPRILSSMYPTYVSYLCTCVLSSYPRILSMQPVHVSCPRIPLIYPTHVSYPGVLSRCPIQMSYPI